MIIKVDIISMIGSTLTVLLAGMGTRTSSKQMVSVLVDSFQYSDQLSFCRRGLTVTSIASKCAKRR